MTSVAIITARGGSKRIPGKNIKSFCGEPIIKYSITTAIKSRTFDEVMVSTDDEQIAEIARSAGASVPFMRSETASGDYTTTDEVIAEVLKKYRELGKNFDRFCCIYPTAPFITGGRLREAMEMLDEHESVTPVTVFSYPPQRGFVTEGGRLKRWLPEFATARSQDIQKIYHDSGQFYACRTDAFLRNNTTDVDDMVPLVLSETEVQDIDTPEDWAIAEQKFGFLRQSAEEAQNAAKESFDDSVLATPYYRIDESALDSDIDMLRTELNNNWNNYIYSYSVKTNALPWLLTHFKSRGFFAEVVSAEEYDLVKRLGFKPNEVIYNGPIKDRETFEEVLLAGGYVNMDSGYEPDWLEALAEDNSDRLFNIGLRVNYDIASILSDEVLADEEGSRFGYSYENGELEKVINRLKGIPNVKLSGLHLHSSTKSRSVNAFRALARVAGLIAHEFELEPDYVDMGGGYYGGVPDKPDFRSYVPAIADELRKYFDVNKTKLIMEPGVSMVSSCFEFVTSVIDAKKIREHEYVVIDGSRVNLNPQVTRRWYPHRIEYNDANYKEKRENKKTQMICGSTCMEYDRLFPLEDEPELRRGDRVVFTNAGGYTVCLSPLFIHYFPAVYVKKTDGTLFAARFPWSNDEYLMRNHY